MREVHEWDGDEADTGPDRSPDDGVGNGDDPRRPAIAVIRDSAARMALAVEYRQRVEGEPAARGDDPGREGSRSQDMAWQPARRTDLPLSARELPNARDVLPNLDKAEIDERKFSEYSMNPGHPDNQGKAIGWRALGYDVDNPQARQKAARELRDLTLEELLGSGKVAEVRDDSYGSRPRVINGIAGPNGKHATMVTCWLIEGRSGTAIPRLITTWVEPHRDKEAGQ